MLRVLAAHFQGPNVMKSATKQEIDQMFNEGCRKGFEDGMMRRVPCSPYSAASIMDRGYRKGHENGQKHRAFLDERNMPWIKEEIEKSSQSGWNWRIRYEGEIKASGHEASLKKATLAADDARLRIASEHLEEKRAPSAKRTTP